MRVATHYRIPTEAVGQMPRAELMTLHVAEREAPWGEAAATLRAMYLAAVIRGGSDGYAMDARRAAAAAAGDLLDQLDAGEFA